MTAHHPHEELLLGYAAGGLDQATAVLVATHLALCPACRRTVAQAEEVGGALIEEIAPAAVRPTALDAVLARCDEPVPVDRKSERGRSLSSLLPRPLCDYVDDDLEAKPWRWRGRGVRYLPLMADRGTRLGLLHVVAGGSVPHHGHGADEFTLVLAGGFSDRGLNYVRGDVQCADPETVHQPVADVDGSCLCLIATRALIRPVDPLTRLFIRFLPI